ncbi:hypothetical protein FOS14_22335 [Skermania sp. ID1734]|nr:hypothetical protein FOS14_22335 [Skermania sp. ID1734]
MYTDSYRRERRRKGLGWLLVSAAVAMAAFHVLTHLEAWRFLPSPQWQDLLVGYPTAGVIALAGFTLITMRARPRA